MSDQKIIWLVKVWEGDCVLKKQFFISCTDERMKKFRVPKKQFPRKSYYTL